MCLISKKPKQTFWNVTYFMVDSWRAARRDVTLASTWTASASVVNLGEGRGQRQTVTQMASPKNNHLCLLHVWVTSLLLLLWLPSLASISSPAFGFLCHSPEIWDDSFRDLNTWPICHCDAWKHSVPLTCIICILSADRCDSLSFSLVRCFTLSLSFASFTAVSLSIFFSFSSSSWRWQERRNLNTLRLGECRVKQTCTTHLRAHEQHRSAGSERSPDDHEAMPLWFDAHLLVPELLTEYLLFSRWK